MNHAVLLPILLPLVCGALLLWPGGQPRRFARGLSLASCAALLVLACHLLLRAGSGEIEVYRLGDWPAPFGIVLVLDRLAALMLLATAVLALPAALYASTGEDRQGPWFHALFQFQLAGLNGAFLTGDLFNLFVFFEILLIASYALLLHGGGRARSGAGLHYVLLNLVGSSLFLIALGIFYGVGGTLNMADLAMQVAMAEGDNARLLEAAALLMFAVFALKAALLPLGFWLPRSYAAAPAAVAALFAVMTKVGIYAILRVTTLIFGTNAGELAQLLTPWLWPLALLTLAFGAAGALGATTLVALIGYLVLISIGTLLAAIALATPESIAAALYYLLHTTWVSGALFLLAGAIRFHRGAAGDNLATAGPALPRPALLGALFLFAAIAVTGLPPLSGFVGKLLILQATPIGTPALWLWTLILGGSLCVLVALSRAGSTLFWRVDPNVSTSGGRTPRPALLAIAALLVASALLSVFGAGVIDYLDATARQLLDSGRTLEQVLMPAGEAPLPPETFNDETPSQEPLP